MDLFVVVVTRRLSCPVIESFGDDDGLGVRGLHCGTQRHRRWGERRPCAWRDRRSRDGIIGIREVAAADCGRVVGHRSPYRRNNCRQRYLSEV
ncbi:hypothetical protein E5345_02990 [Propionibacterium sp. NM47_B9-13]|nr:hypothetical protein HMPREF9621_01444 [Cutibacterium modestum HL037PA2]EFT15137.1 hypothetical protein HMPREF9622_01772 [Cutibacterium modestum HL037PA3]REB73818.1 hypothetical protein CP877_09825 [Cutibacterium modestum]TGY30229.1 hypothetical protein E5345_02990 [Propionibacterium sp. NM47_B9-13]